MSREGNGHHPFFRNKLLWLGFGLAASINLINGTTYLFPVLPQIPLGYNLNVYFTERPFNAMGNLPAQFNPFAIGLAFAIPLDLLFSCWFFFLLWKAQRVIGSMVGISMPGYPLLRSRSLAGIWESLSSPSGWGRKPIWQVIKRAIGQCQMRTIPENQ